MLTRSGRLSPLNTVLKHRPTISKRFKATIIDLELDQRYGHGPGEPYNTMEYKFGMPTPPLSPKLGQKSRFPLQLASWGAHMTGLTSYPDITMEQDLQRLKYHLDQLPTSLLKHVHLQRVRRQNPNLFFAALADDISGL
jgi:hypothetical protein